MTKERMTQVLCEKNTAFIIAEFDNAVVELMLNAGDDHKEAIMIAIHAAMLKAKLLKQKGVI